jgi:hypothetical protein
MRRSRFVPKKSFDLAPHAIILEEIGRRFHAHTRMLARAGRSIRPLDVVVGKFKRQITRFDAVRGIVKSILCTRGCGSDVEVMLGEHVQGYHSAVLERICRLPIRATLG